MNKIRISAVSYTNTKPFIYGIQHSGILDKIELSLDMPSDCAQKLIDDVVDIGLIPVAATLNLPHWEIVSEYCIGAVGAVNSVFIFSNCDVKDIKYLQLDPQSRSSNNLARVLLKNYWKVYPELIKDADDYSESTEANTAFVQIGDRTFGKKNKYKYAYDLAEEWQNFKDLPFMFAGWIANKPIPQDFMNEFNAALKYGLDHRAELFEELPMRDDFDIQDYLMHKIDFDLTDGKKKALYMFLDYIKAL
ncbi:menaquinone biosynthetic enzyme MqnA/MqnD family protein [Mucilaginibacter lappiensis]|uniref:Chorismate dehydratase n=1 Tax=Mucilaginibacter lappiensis TaxID=354630 RepID=A0A1N6WLL4_9SPHI|nr:menaquinone biosynthesis protein [Mucilaginibacter lappiensis]MBB6109550.1 chorismate dehydratase [Mucilaginibacter lappiensis]MBB6127787.1 chorismate dehydratase [Mucilaginibacter lappiensis]SIQ90964.1 chorismate dehydratase [Mucilaginibacter lappiensis]